jgi:hypothetical protein
MFTVHVILIYVVTKLSKQLQWLWLSLKSSLYLLKLNEMFENYLREKETTRTYYI